MPPDPQADELPIDSSCHCVKPKHLLVHTILLMQNVMKQQFAQFRPTGNSYDRPSSAHSSVVGKLLRSMRSLASFSQNHTGYIKTFVMSYFKPPSLLFHTSYKSRPPSSSEHDIIFGQPL